MKMSEPKELTELKEIIKSELGECDVELWPELCAMRQSDTGYAKVEEMIIRYVAKEAMPVESAIALIEMELAHSGIESLMEKE